MDNVGTVLAIVGGLLALATVLSGAIAVTKGNILSSTNTMLDNALRQTRSELVDSEARCKDDLNVLSKKHDRDMAELRGRVDAMTPQFAAEIAAALARLGKRVGDA